MGITSGFRWNNLTILGTSKSDTYGSEAPSTEKAMGQPGSADSKAEHKGPTRLEVMKSLPKSATLEEMQN